jgi:glycosyltransferase involved in cell wall biosynthesis
VAHLFKVMLTGNFGIVHLFLPHAYLVGAPLAFFSRIPVRIMSRRSLNLYQTERWFLRPLEKLLHRTMSAIVANSVMVWRELREQEAVPDKRLAIIYSGVDTERFASGEDAREQLRKSLAVSESDLVITSVANLIPYKGHHDLIRAIAHAAPNLSRQWKLLIVGRDDGIGAELKQMVHGYALTEHVVFLGARDDVPDILAASDIGVLPSHQEGFPNAALEVMAAGLPMIVTDVGGAAEAVQHNVTGFVVERGDPEALSAAILRLVHDHELRSRFGHAGQRQIAAQFSLDRCVSDYELLYSNLIARSGIPQRLRARNVLAARTPGPDDQGRSNCDTILDMGYSSTCLSGGSRS